MFELDETVTETTEDYWEKLFELANESNFQEFSTNFHVSNIITLISDSKLRNKLLEVTDLDVLKLVEEIQQDRCDRKIKKTTYREL